MAIYFNNRLLEPKQDGNSLEKRFYVELQEVKKVFDTFRKKGEAKSTLIFTRDFPKVWNTKKTTYKPAPPIALPMVANIYLQDIGSVQIRYSKSAPIIGDNNRYIWQNTNDLFYETKSIGEDEIDLAWFYLKASDFLKKGVIKLVNKKQEFDSDFDKLKKQAKPFSLLFDDARTEEELLGVASVLFPDGKVSYDGGKSELAIQIWDFVKYGEQNGKPWNYDALVIALENEIKNKATNKRGQVILTENEDSDDNEASPLELLKAPVGVKREELSAKAASLGIRDEGQTKDMLYSLIKRAEKEGVTANSF